MKLLTACLLLLILSGCAMMHRPSEELISNADYGSYPGAYREIVDRFMRTSPTYQESEPLYSNWHGPAKGYTYDSSGVYFGYIVCVEVRTRNEVGGFTVGQPYMHIINDGEVIKVEGGQPLGTSDAGTVQTACRCF